MICAFSLCFFLALSLTIDWPGSGPLLYIGSRNLWMDSLPDLTPDWRELASILFIAVACCNVYPKHALAKQKQDKRPVLRLFLLSSSRLVFSISFRLIFLHLFVFLLNQKSSLRFSFNFIFHLLFSFPSSVPIVVDAWFLLLPYCDSLGYLWDCSMCPHAVRLSCRGVCAVKL